MGDKPYASVLLEALHQLQQTGYLCDTVLVAEDGQLKAHSAVLAAASSLFKEGLPETGKPIEHVIVLTGFQCYILEIALNFIYSGELEMPDKCLVQDGKKQIIAALERLGLQIPSNCESVHQTHSISILTTLQQFQRTGYLCDTVLIAEDQQLRAHSAVLAAASPLFKEGLPPNEKPMERVMVLSEFEFCTVTFALHYIYCGSLEELDLTESYTSAVASALEKLGVQVSYYTESSVFDEFALQNSAKVTDSFTEVISNRILSRDSRLWNCLSTSANAPDSNTSHVNGGDIAVMKIEDRDNEIEPVDGTRSEKACKLNEMKVKMWKSRQWDHKQSSNNGNCRAVTWKNKPLSTRSSIAAVTTGTDTDTVIIHGLGGNRGVQSDLLEIELPANYAMEHKLRKKRSDYGRSTLMQECKKLQCTRPINSRGIVAADIDNDVESNQNAEEPILQPKLSKMEKAFKDVSVRKRKLGKHSKQMERIELQCVDIPPKPKMICSRSEEGRATYICDICGITILSAGALIQHKRVHTKHSSRHFECEVCGARMFNHCNFRRHLLSHRGRRDYLCQECGQSFTRLANLKDHIRKLHTEGISSDPDFKPFACPTCDERFHTPYWLKHHKIAAHLPGDDEARRLALKRSKLPPLEKLYFCQTCNDRFASKTILSAHMRVHADTTSFPFQCQICGKRFAVKSTLNVHSQTVHTELRLHECTMCKTRYKSKDGLRYHIKRIHSPKEPQHKLYQCSVCNTSFECARLLKEHPCTQQGHACSTCGKQFASYSLLLVHETVHHVNSDSRRYECSVCKLKFRQLHHLRSHELRHSAQRPMYQCIICKKVYKKKLSLKLHSARTHDIELSKNAFYSLPVSLDSLKAVDDIPVLHGL